MNLPFLTRARAIRSAIYLTLAVAALAVAQSPVPTCTVADIRGNPIQGAFCGGAFGSTTCTAGAIYTCSAGPAGTTNNCKLSQNCANGCLLGSSSACYTGAAPLTISSLNPTGGSPITLTSQLSVTHAAAIINLKILRGDLIPGAFCAVPALADNQTLAAFNLSTAAVTAPTPVQVYTDTAFNDTAGMHELISPLQIVTLQPGRTNPPPPPLASFTLAPSTIGPSGMSEVNVTLTSPAPANGVQVALTSSDPATAFPVPGAAPMVLGSCLTGGGAFSVEAANNVPAQKVVTNSAAAGAPGELPQTQPLTVTAGCVRNVCSFQGACGPMPDGCGGTLNCGCLTGLTCGGGGVPGFCGAPIVVVASLLMSPSTIAAGQSSTGTITLSQPAGFGGNTVTLSSNSPFVSVPSFLSILSGGTSTTFTATTSGTPSAPIVATITATLGGTATSTLTVTPPGACVPTTCSAAGKNCGSISDGCGGTGGGGGTVVVTLTVSGKGGNVTSTPAGLNVQSGSSASAMFSAGSVVTLKTDNGHGAIWSGLCSSGGKAAQTCTFTANASGSETAVEQ